MENKKFKLVDEQINHLKKNRKLKVNNYDKLKWYLLAFNYQRFIDGYSTPFLENNSHDSIYFKEYVSDDVFISFFNYERNIVSFLLGSVLEIESKINTAIAYQIMKWLNNKKGIDNTIFPIENKTIFDELLPNFNKDKNFDDEFIKKVNIDKDDFLYEKYCCSDKENFKSIPIYKFCIKWTFNNSIQLSWFSNKTIKDNIFSEHFYEFKKCIYNVCSPNDLKNISTEILFAVFSFIFFVFKKLRNKLVHNEVIWNFKVKFFFKNIQTRKQKEFCKKIINKFIDKDLENDEIRLFDLINCISVLTFKKNETKEKFLEKTKKFLCEYIKEKDNNEYMKDFVNSFYFILKELGVPSSEFKKFINKRTI